jgi:hypothetical protein
MALKRQPFLQEQPKCSIIFNDQNAHFLSPKAEIHQHSRSHYRFGCVWYYLGS